VGVELALKPLDAEPSCVLAAVACLELRFVTLEGGDPTAEVIVRHLYRALATALRPGTEVSSAGGATYRVPAGVRLESVRLWETPTSWAEYSEDEGRGERREGRANPGTGTGDMGQGSGQ
jgi:hypothetical protein